MSHHGVRGEEDDDVRSEAGDIDPFRPGASGARGGQRQGVQTGTGGPGITRSVAPSGAGWGRGPYATDKRKFRYDVNAALVRKALPFGATKVDRLDPTRAGELLDRIHKVFGIDTELEERIFAFDQGLWYEHAVNGGSTLQVERGVIYADGVEFEIPVIVKILGVDSRRFFRAYADDIARCLRAIIDSYSPYDPESAEKHAAIMQVAVARGLQKYPHLIHDSSDAGSELSIEERMALQVSKRHVIPTSVNAADSIAPRVDAREVSGTGTPTQQVVR